MRKKMTASDKRRITTVSWIALVAFLTFYIVYQLSNDFTPAMVTGNAVNAGETVYSTFDAYIMRDESVLVSENAGFCDYLVDNGGYAGKQTPLARVYTSTATDVVARISEIDEELELLNDSCQRLDTGNMKTVKSKINSAYARITASLASGDTATALAESDNLTNLLYLLELNTGLPETVEAQLDAAKSRAADLLEERDGLCRTLGEYITLSSEATGNFFHNTDGLEEAYSSVDIENMSLADFSEMLAAAPLTDAERGGCTVGSYMKNYTWYIAVPCDMSIAAAFNENSDYSILFSYTSGAELTMTLERIVRENNTADAIMVFSCDSTPAGFDRARKQKIDIKISTYTGYRINCAALRTENGKTGVWILKNGKVSWRDVSVLYDNGLYCIVKSQPLDPAEYDGTRIAPNDLYIISDSGLYEGKLIK